MSFLWSPPTCMEHVFFKVWFVCNIYMSSLILIWINKSIHLKAYVHTPHPNRAMVTPSVVTLGTKIIPIRRNRQNLTNFLFIWDRINRALWRATHFLWLNMMWQNINKLVSDTVKFVLRFWLFPRDLLRSNYFNANTILFDTFYPAFSRWYRGILQRLHVWLHLRNAWS